MEAMEQTMTVELTEEQYVHIQQILKMNKPSRTRLTSTEKKQIKYMCNWWLSSFSELDENEINTVESIIKKLN